MMILSENGVKRIERDATRQLASGTNDGTVVIPSQELWALIAYYHQLTKLCDHEWDYGSPIDAGLCRKCGKFE